MRISVNEK